MTYLAPRVSRKCRRLLYALVFLLVFEGLLRKLLPPLSLPIFFMKDILCLYGLVLVNSVRLSGNVLRLHALYKKLFLLFLPVVFFTLIRDPVLVVFGLKQYLLYVVVGILVPLAFPAPLFNDFKKFVAFFSLLIIPTTMVAVMQNSLPGSHWLNLSVDGGSLEGFSAGGRLRVSSTFAFTGQYGFFLNAVAVFYAARFFLKPNYKNFFLNNIDQLLLISIGVALLIGIFITGGRTSVLGTAACVMVGLALLMYLSPKQFLKKGIVSVLFLLVSLSVLRVAKPEYFAAYDARSTDTGSYSQSADIKSRAFTNFLGWTKFVQSRDMLGNIFGRGLGVMSNGSERLSNYASNVKGSGVAPESDMEIVAWEGGLYLWLTFYGFRLYMVWFCFRLLRSLKDKKLVAAAAFLMGLVILSALIGGMSKQPPISIWWWLSIGSMLVIKSVDDGMRKKTMARPRPGHNRFAFTQEGA